MKLVHWLLRRFINMHVAKTSMTSFSFFANVLTFKFSYSNPCSYQMVLYHWGCCSTCFSRSSRINLTPVAHAYWVWIDWSELLWTIRCLRSVWDMKDCRLNAQANQSFQLDLLKVYKKVNDFECSLSLRYSVIGLQYAYWKMIGVDIKYKGCFKHLGLGLMHG